MKKQLILLIAVILGFNGYSQITFEKGYYIDNDNQKVNCLIKTTDWNNNPTEFEYKLSETSKTKSASLKSIKEFEINGIAKYIKSDVRIDRSNEVISKISKNRNPEFKNEKLFLKVLIEGKASLYQYLDNSLTRYFYKTKNSNIKQLIYKSYKTAENKIAVNNQFRQQLLNDLKCTNFKTGKFKNLGYNLKDLKSLFIEYSQCYKYSLNDLEPKQKRDFFNLTIRSRFNSSSLTVQNSDFDSRDIIDFGNKTGFGIGLEAELVLPINKNKWTILIEPTYQSFKSETINNNVSVIFGGEIESKFDYSSIEIPIGLRHYFFLYKNSNIFVNAYYIFDLSSKSSFEFNTSASSNTSNVILDTDGNLAFGIGYQLYNKYSLEIRYQTSRELIKQNSIWSSDYKTFSIIFGYSIF
jgi:hypothetical protein